MNKSVRRNSVSTDTVPLEQANELMRSANLALGFSHEHIGELKQNGGFRSSTIAQNTRMITRLLYMDYAYA